MKRAQIGSVAVTAILVIALLSIAGFAGWAFTERQDYKNNVDQKVAKAVTAAETAQKVKLEKQFAEEEKDPYRTYTGSITFGTVTFSYPKTWSSYIDESSSDQPINGYFHPDQVPGLQSNTAYALRLQLVSTDYAQIIHEFDAMIKSGQVKATAYVPSKMVAVPNVQPGMRFDGEISEEKQGSLVAIKVRDKTLQIYSESKDFLADFNNVILPSLTFVP